MHKYCYFGIMVFLLLNTPVFPAIKTKTSMKIVKNTIEVQTVFVNESKQNFYVLLNNWMIFYDVDLVPLFRDSYNANFLYFIEKTSTLKGNTSACLSITPMSEVDPIFFKVPAKTKRKLITIIKFDTTLNMVSAFQNMKGLVEYSYVDEAVFLTSKEMFKGLILYDKKVYVLNLFEGGFFNKEIFVKRNYFRFVFYTPNLGKVHDPILSTVFRKIIKYSTQMEIVPIMLQ